MGSGEAKKFRQMYGSAGRHGESFWQEERANIGLKLLKSMGWESGQGLGKQGNGRVEAVKQFRKTDNAGIGANAATRDETFRASQDLFNGILARLAGKAGPAEEAELGGGATSLKGMVAKQRLAHRFRKAKDTADCDRAALNEIFGRAADVPERPGAQAGASEPGLQPEGQHTSSVSVSDYFARKRRELGLAPSTAAASSGFTLADQTMFAETQVALAYSGRFGLGHATGSARDEEPNARANSFHTYPPPARAPPAVGGSLLAHSRDDTGGAALRCGVAAVEETSTGKRHKKVKAGLQAKAQKKDKALKKAKKKDKAQRDKAQKKDKARKLAEGAGGADEAAAIEKKAKKQKKARGEAAAVEERAALVAAEAAATPPKKKRKAEAAASDADGAAKKKKVKGVA
eukprot:CAMPEP_0119379534 /NCGR_PEP_ID=MMETSP1334-20130426/53132_1 /TAXON_ID=127549 /ORGANISM="Calcidiscus leptoporus, Strain RCC1130" /LENGTH=402 /DNA_ID=CAMNT_0007399075 /DNA_START=59 /DNA_END=1267 /DNA_ORIENTATION=+